MSNIDSKMIISAGIIALKCQC